VTHHNGIYVLGGYNGTRNNDLFALFINPPSINRNGESILSPSADISVIQDFDFVRWIRLLFLQ